MLASGLNAPKKIVVDATDVYYIDAAGPGALYRVSKSGGAPTLLSNVGSIQTDTWDWDVVVDDSTVYLLHGGRQPSPSTVDAGTIEFIPKNGAARRTVVAASSSCHTAFPHKLAVVDGQLYWRQTDVVDAGEPACSGEVATYSIVALDATTMQQSVVAQPASGNAFTADANHLFWCDVDGTHRAPRSPSGTTETLAPLVLAEIVTDGNAIFGYANDNVEAITAPGQYRVLFGGTKQVLGLAVDDANLYFATFSGVHRMGKDGSNDRLFIIGNAAAVTVDATNVYYFSGSNLMTACK